MRKGACFICDTPYQLLNILNYTIHQEEFSNDELDLLICTRDFDEQLINRIRELKLFRNIYPYKTDLETGGQGRNILYRCKRFLFPKSFVAGFLEDKSFDCGKYEYLFCAFPMPITVAITMINPDIKLRLMDDGIGTYITGIPIPDSKKRKLIYSLRGKTSPWSRIEKVYVNNKKMYAGTIAGQVVSLTPYDKVSSTFLNAVHKVFLYTNSSLYHNYKTVYLTQALDVAFDEPERFWEIEKKVIDALEETKGQVIIRKHPKHKNYIDHRFKEDDDNNLWELVCADQIMNDNILIGCFSTAQFSPKFLFNKEPMIVFTYDLYEEAFNSEKKKEMAAMIDRLREAYADDSRIAVVSDYEGLKDAVDKLCEMQRS